MKRRMLGTIGCIFGLLGVFAAVLAHHVIARAPEQPPGWEVEVNITENVKWRYGNKPPAPPESTPLVSRDSMTLAAIGMACVAIAFSVASWIRREGIALGVLASFLGRLPLLGSKCCSYSLCSFSPGGPCYGCSGFGASVRNQIERCESLTPSE
jgi:hypothetical protein